MIEEKGLIILGGINTLENTEVIEKDLKKLNDMIIGISFVDNNDEISFKLEEDKIIIKVDDLHQNSYRELDINRAKELRDWLNEQLPFIYKSDGSKVDIIKLDVDSNSVKPIKLKHL